MNNPLPDQERVAHASAQAAHKVSRTNSSKVRRTASQPPRLAYRISIQAIMVITAVFAATAFSIGHLYRAASGDPSQLGTFVITTAMLPMVMLAAASTFFRIFGRWLR